MAEATSNDVGKAADIEQAARYLEALTGDRNTPVTWCLLHDKKSAGKHPMTMYGPLSQHGARIAALNRGGYGVFIAVNEVKANERRNKQNIVAVRALFTDSDAGPMREPELAPSFRVQSARGEHLYWALVPNEPLLLFEPSQHQLAAFFGSDPTVCDLPRLMRVPGFLHQKGEPFLVRFAPGTGVAYTIADVLRAHPVTPEQLKANKKVRPAPTAPGPGPGPGSADLPSMQERKTRAGLYLRQMPPAVEGGGGDSHTFKVACVVVRDFAVDNFDDAMEVLQAWNSGCVPPWDERDLAQKVISALRNGQGASGSKLTRPRRQQVGTQTANQDWAKEAPGNPQDHESTDDVAEAHAENSDALASVTELALGGLEGATNNDDYPFSLELACMMAEDASSALRPQVVNMMERLQREDPGEYSRCLFEVKAAQKGLLNEVKRAIRARRQARLQEAAESLREDTRQVVDVLPAAKTVVTSDHRVPFGYVLAWNGVSKLVEKKTEDGPEMVEVPICDRPVVIKGALDRVDGGTLLQMAFRTRDTGEWHTVTAPRDVVMTSRLLSGLALHRFPVYSGNAADVAEYLVKYETANEKFLKRTPCAVQMGWQDDKRELGFLVGKRHFAPADYKGEPIEFSADSEGDTLLAQSFRQEGTADAWFAAVDTVTKYPRVHLGVLASLAAPLLDLLGLDNFFIDYSGETSGGKTTTLRVAASVWGAPEHRKYSMLRSWNTTVAGMERTAASLTGLPLFIDESNEAQTPLERQAMAKMIYQLANGRGRTRATRTGGTQALRHWSTVILSSGEQPITTATQDAGTRARVLAMEDSPFGGVTDETSADVADLTSAVRDNHGHAGPMFVEWIMAHLADVPSWKRRHGELSRGYIKDPKVPKAVGERLARHLALLDLTGELATDAFGLPVGYESPVRVCVSNVMEGAQDADKPKDAFIEVASQAFAQKARFFGEANYDPLTGYIGKRTVTCGDGVQCLALTSDFVRKTLQASGHNYYAVTRSWSQRGYLFVGSHGKSQRFCKIEGAAVRCFCLRYSCLDPLMKADS